jgi:hypothetical protein
MPTQPLNPQPTELPHIAARIHLSQLPTQQLPATGNPVCQLFGVSLCTAPYAVNGQAYPPLASSGDLLGPYLPWAWTWLEKPASADPGFRWTLLVRMVAAPPPHGPPPNPPPPPPFAWMPVPADKLIIYGSAGIAIDDGLTSIAPPGAATGPGAAGPTSIHDTWWKNELSRLVISGSSWTTPGSGALPLAHSQRLGIFYSSAADSPTKVPEGRQDSHEDLLGSRMLRWATGTAPYNFLNRLAAIFALPSYAELQTIMKNAYPGYVMPDGAVGVVAVPLWVSGDYTASKPFDAGYESANFLVADQAKVPISGNAGAINGAYLRRSYVNVINVKADGSSGQPVSPGGTTLEVEVEPWRRDLEQRVSRVIDLPMLLLDWTTVTVQFKTEMPTGQPPSWACPDAFVASGDLVKWVAILAADLFQTYGGLKNPPTDVATWLNQIKNAASATSRLKDSVDSVLNYLAGVAVPTNDAAGWIQDRLRVLREFMQLLRNSKQFLVLRTELEAAPVLGESDPASRTDWIADAQMHALDFKFSDGQTIRQRILPALNYAQRNIDPLFTTLANYLQARTQSTTARPPMPPMPAIDTAAATALDSFLRATSLGAFTSNPPPGKAVALQNIVFGDPAQPISQPHGFSLVANSKESVLNADGSTDNADDLDENAGSLVLARLARSGQGPHTQWVSLNAGKLHLSLPSKAQEFQASSVVQPPLRGSYINKRRSESVVYDNRPLVATSTKRLLTMVDKSELQADSNAQGSSHPRPEYRWPSGEKLTIPPLRYFGTDCLYEFCWIRLANSCCLPQGFWTAHPAVLDLTSPTLPKDPTALRQLGVSVSEPTPYLRRVAIAASRMAISFTYNAAGRRVPNVTASNGQTLNLQDKTWPMTPAGVFPLAGEVPTQAAPPQTPLVVLFPATGDVPSSGPALSQPQLVAHQMTLSVGKPRTSDENWERWVSVNSDPATTKARLKVCQEAHRERDLTATHTPPDILFDPSHPDNPDNSQPQWQPDDPALSQQFLIVFRRLYPSNANLVKGFVRTYAASANAAYYGDALGFFTAPFQLTLISDGKKTLPPGTLVSSLATAAGTGTFLIESGVVLEMGIYSLLLPADRDRFAMELISPKNGPNSLGEPVATLLGTNTPPDGFVGDPTQVLAVSPNFLRVETAELQLPSSRQLYDSLLISAQGAKVHLGISRTRDAVFDFAHEVVAQEQIWSWSGKPSLPEDFPGASIQLPKPGDSTLQRAEHFPWDGIAFHQRQDGEHLAVGGLLPLRRSLPTTPGASTPTADPGEIIFTDDKTSDLRALYFRFSAQLRSRYFGAWPGASQAGDLQQSSSTIAPLWKRFVLPLRLNTPLKKPFVVLVIPLLASGNTSPSAGDSAGVLAIVREAAFEQAGLAEILECQVISSSTYQSSGGTTTPDGQQYLQLGYDPTLSSVALLKSPVPPPQDPPSPIRITGPVGLTFDDTSRDPLIVNSIYFVDVYREALSVYVPAPNLSQDPPQKAPAAHLFCEMRFRRKIRSEFAPDPKNPGALNSEWTQSQWVKFLPDSDLLRPQGSDPLEWVLKLSPTGLPQSLENWNPPVQQANDQEFLLSRLFYLFCITKHDLDATGRPATQFHSLHLIEKSTKALTEFLSVGGGTLPSPPLRRIRGRIIEILAGPDATGQSPTDFLAGLKTTTSFFPTPHAGVTKDAGTITDDTMLVAQSISAAYPVTVSGT